MALRQILLPGVDGPGVLTTSIQREGARRHRQFKSFFKEEGSKLPVVRSQLVNPHCESHPSCNWNRKHAAQSLLGSQYCWKWRPGPQGKGMKLMLPSLPEPGGPCYGLWTAGLWNSHGLKSTRFPYSQYTDLEHPQKLKWWDGEKDQCLISRG